MSLSSDHTALMAHITKGSMAVGIVHTGRAHPHPVIAYRDKWGWFFICSGQYNYLFPVTKDHKVFLETCEKLRLQWTPQ